MQQDGQPVVISDSAMLALRSAPTPTSIIKHQFEVKGVMRLSYADRAVPV